MSSNSTSRSLDAALDVLSHSTRRYVLWYLDRDATDARVSVETLASAVAAWQAGGEESADDSDARQRALASLRHVHLPRLESAGVIERTRGAAPDASGAVADGSGATGAEYVEATTEGTPVDAFFDAGLVEAFEAGDRP